MNFAEGDSYELDTVNKNEYKTVLKQLFYSLCTFHSDTTHLLVRICF